MRGALCHGSTAYTRYIAVALLCTIASSGVGATTDDDVEAGRRIYREGISITGKPLEAFAGAGTALRGADAACVACHRRSGLGGGEGGRLIRPIGNHLFVDAQTGRESRTLYTPSTLDRALRDGVDADGRGLDALMPRYHLSKADLDNLVAYLRTLNATPDPGVTDTELHLATIIAGDVPPDRRAAVLDVLQTYVKVLNQDIRGEGRRARKNGRGGENMYSAYRRWVLHVWELTGMEHTWPAQLEALYRELPVFAVIGGTGVAGWTPVHEFCERNEVPCMFPSIDNPVIMDGAAYSVYLSRGVALEADTLADFLLRRADARMPGRIVQVHRPDGASAAAARALQAALRRAGAAPPEDVVVQTKGPPVAAFWTGLAQHDESAVLVLWLASDDLVEMKTPDVDADAWDAVFVSATLGGEARFMSAQALQGDAFLLTPFVLPEQRERTLARTLAWLRPHGIAAGEVRTRAETYLAITLAADALRHMAGNFNRDYFVERVEHAAANSLASALFPRISLGPGQRYAAKGCYVVKRSRDPGTVSASGLALWITP